MPTKMPQFISLPSGLVVNLDLVNRMVPTDEQSEQSLTLYFSTGDLVILSPEDASALRKRAMIQGTTVSNRTMVTVFWFVILLAIVLTYLAVRNVHG